MAEFTVVKDWTTAAGFRAVIIMGSLGHHCGYVAVPKEHPLFGKDYGADCECLTFPADEPAGKRGVFQLLCNNGEARPEVVFDVHGSLTYSGGNEKYPVPASDVWWFGYDCGHCYDAPSDEYLEQQRAKYPDLASEYSRSGGIFRDVDYNVAECESLAKQLISRVNFNLPK